MPTSTGDVNKHLATLGLEPDDLNEDAIRLSYKKLALQWHPDRHNADPEEAKEKFIEVNTAYMALVEECKKRNKRKKSRKEDGNSSRRPFWAGSTPSTSTTTSSTPSASSSQTSHASASTSTSKETEIPTKNPKDSRTARPPPTLSTKSPDSPSVKPGDVPRNKPSHRTAKHTDTRKEETRRSGDRDPSQSLPRKEGSHATSSTSSRAAHQTPRPPKSSNPHPDTGSDSSSEEESLRDRKHGPRPHHTKGKKPTLGEDDYEFIDLGCPLKPLRAPKPLSSKDWIFPLHLTLEDLYYGATHRYRITRTLRPSTPHSHSSAPPSSSSSGKSQTVQIDVRVAPGWHAGTRIRVPGVGNQRADGSFQDIVFVVAEAPHARFARAVDDLVLPVRVPWVDAHPQPHLSSPRDRDHDLYGDDDSTLAPGDDGGSGEGGRYRFGWGRRFHHPSRARAPEQEREEDEDEVYVLGIDGEEYTLPIPRTLVEAADGTRIFGAGMPVRKNGKAVGKGDLVIRWEFAFPESDKLGRSRWQTLKDAMHLRFQV